MQWLPSYLRVIVVRPALWVGRQTKVSAGQALLVGRATVTPARAPSHTQARAFFFLFFFFFVLVAASGSDPSSGDTTTTAPPAPAAGLTSTTPAASVAAGVGLAASSALIGPPRAEIRVWESLGFRYDGCGHSDPFLAAGRRPAAPAGMQEDSTVSAQSFDSWQTRPPERFEDVSHAVGPVAARARMRALQRSTPLSTSGHAAVRRVKAYREEKERRRLELEQRKLDAAERLTAGLVSTGGVLELHVRIRGRV